MLGVIYSLKNSIGAGFRPAPLRFSIKGTPRYLPCMILFLLMARAVCRAGIASAPAGGFSFLFVSDHQQNNERNHRQQNN